MKNAKPRALILHATGTNRDEDAALALRLAGAEPEIVHLNALKAKEKRWSDYQLLVVPGGFSYADALGAGRLLALDLSVYFADEIAAFSEAHKPIIGICNGFQALVKAGILPGPGQNATLSCNEEGRFECRWVRLGAPESRSLWTRGIRSRGLEIACPVAHGEGRFLSASAEELEKLKSSGQIALYYAGSDGRPAGGVYPQNPNGSSADIAGVCNPEGNILGLMPHPENNVLVRPTNRDPLAQEACLELWKSGVEYAKECL